MVDRSGRAALAAAVSAAVLVGALATYGVVRVRGLAALPSEPPVTVALCFESIFESAHVRRNDPGRLKAKRAVFDRRGTAHLAAF